MKRYLFLLCTLALAAAGPALGADSWPDRLNMFVGDTRIVPAESARIAIGNGQIVSVSSLGPKQLLFLAATPGVTTVNLALKNGQERNITVAVTEANMEVALENINKLLQGTENIRSRIAGNKVVLEGDRVSDADQQRAASIVDSYGGLVLNFIGKVGFEQMIHFAVKIIEVRRNFVRQLGIRWDPSVNGPSVGTITDFATNDLFRVAPPGNVANQLQFTQPIPPGVDVTATYAGLTSVLNSRIEILEQQGKANIISEPTLSCRSGGNARFVAGGELPIPTQGGFGQTDVEFKEFGVILDVKPVADRLGTIYAQIDTEVSQVDPTVSVLGVPGFTKRRSTTEVNMRDGETIAISGLVDRSRARDTQQIPGLGSIPFIGAAFRTRGTRENETELVVLLTPRIVTAQFRPGLFAADPDGEAVDRGRELLNSPEAPPRKLGPPPKPAMSPPPPRPIPPASQPQSAPPATPRLPTAQTMPLPAPMPASTASMPAGTAPMPTSAAPSAQGADDTYASTFAGYEPPAYDRELAREIAREKARMRRENRERRAIEQAIQARASIFVSDRGPPRPANAR
jgi:pilus assembly protein CpaC